MHALLGDGCVSYNMSQLCLVIDYCSWFVGDMAHI